MVIEKVVTSIAKKEVNDFVNDDEVEEVYDETANFMASTNSKISKVSKVVVE